MAISMNNPTIMLVAVFTIQAILMTPISCAETYHETLSPPIIASEDSPAKLYAEIGAVCSLLESIAKLDSLSTDMESIRLKAVSSMGNHIQSNMCNWANLKLDEELLDDAGQCEVDKLLDVCVQVRAYNIATGSQDQE